MAEERLIIFTRYPEAGKTKTRLIPALGAEGAAQLQRQMTEHTIAQVSGQPHERAIEVRFTGATSAQMQAWLGSSLTYQPQGSGDLGARLTEAFGAAFTAGTQRVVAIGIDCPELDAVLLNQAFQALQQHDLVLGTATDGGYYLIGLKRSIPELFEEIAWGTETVWQETVAIAQQLGLSIAYLRPLTDVDRPEDLAVWQQAQETRANSAERISVVIPTLNEAQSLPATLAHLCQTPNVEVIVVDGGSQDQTAIAANRWGATVIRSQPGRAQQMNAGAAIASGDILLFLHADTRLSAGFADAVRQTLMLPNTIAGAFQLQIDGAAPGLRWVERGVNWRSRYFQMPYGDQALFLKAETFRQLGGFPNLPLMEDFELVRQLKQQGRVAIAPLSVLTSARRWEQLGVWQTTLLNQVIIGGYLLGVSPDRLAAWYRGRRQRQQKGRR